MRLGYNLGLVSKLEYYFLVLYAVVKYVRRIILVQLGLNGSVNWIVIYKNHVNPPDYAFYIY